MTQPALGGKSLTSQAAFRRSTLIKRWRTPERWATTAPLWLQSLVVVHAFLAGQRTVADPDLGWQMATERWMIQRRQIPSVDVLSYSAHGQ